MSEHDNEEMGEEPEVEMVDFADLDEGKALAQLNKAVHKAHENIADLNTEPKANRTVTLKLTLAASENRAAVGIKYKIESKIVGEKGGAVMVTLERDRKGRVHASEIRPRSRTIEMDFGDGTGKDYDPETGEVIDFKDRQKNGG